VHGEHGWNVGDLDGSNVKNRRLRRLVRPLVDHYIALSQQQLYYLRDSIGVRTERIAHICNGVDVARFKPAAENNATPFPAGFVSSDSIVLGSVMRLQSVKAPGDLVRAFIGLRALLSAEQFSRLRLVMVGDGPLRETLLKDLAAAGLASQSWLPGSRDDVPQLLRAMDLFVLPSLAEGICNTILEAMASGLPVIATEVGGNPDLIRPGENGTLLPAGQPDRLAQTLAAYLQDQTRRDREGRQARIMAEDRFSLEAMVQGYMAVYDKVLSKSHQ
jgi:sugar transferase (PEP-CTERM/EpsH1 system associated)